MIYFVNHTFNIYYALDYNIMLFKYHDTIVNWNRILKFDFVGINSFCYLLLLYKYIHIYYIFNVMLWMPEITCVF